MDLVEEVRELRETVVAMADKIDRLVDPPKFLKPADVAEMLCCSEDFLIDHRNARTGPPFTQTSNKFVRYKLSDVLEWAQLHQVS